jgi:hypothetical protein
MIFLPKIGRYRPVTGGKVGPGRGLGCGPGKGILGRGFSKDSVPELFPVPAPDDGFSAKSDSGFVNR